MINVVLKGIALIALFFAAWFGLKQVNWVNIFKVQVVTDNTEKKLGEMFWDVIQKTEKENKDPEVTNPVDSIVSKICLANNIDRDFIKVHILVKDDINAFALPNGHLVIYSGLITACNNEGELSGVICHELAHIQLNHVTKKLVKEIGLSALISITTGNGGAEIAKQAAKMLSSTAFDRSLEKEADIKAVDYLASTNINPESLANFLYIIAGNDDDSMKYLSWISTHPDSKERAQYIIDYCKGKEVKQEPVIAAATWNEMKESLKK